MKTTDTPKTDSSTARTEKNGISPIIEYCYASDAREIEIQRNELLACMEFIRDVITGEPIADAIEEVGWNHENGTPIQWVEWCLKRVRKNSLENVIGMARRGQLPI